MDVLTLKNYPSEASIMVARQLKIVSQVDAFLISAARNIHNVFKKLVCFTDCMRCLATKIKIPLIFIYRRIVLPWKQNCAFETRNLLCLRVCLFMLYC